MGVITPVFVEVPCQVCGSRESEEAYARTVETTEHGRVEMRLLLCHGCGFVYASPRPTRGAVRARRDAAVPGGGAANARRAARTHEEFVRRCAARFQDPGRLLDVGCGRGELLGMLKLAGWRLVGLEPSRRAAEAARQRGLDVIETTLEENPLAAESFDLVTCLGGLERAWDVRAAMFTLERLLTPGGLFVVHVPDTTRPVAGIPEFFPFENLSHFTPGTLTRLLTESGFRPLTLERSDAPGLFVCARKEGGEPVSDVDTPDERAELRERFARYRREQAALESGILRRFARLRERWEEESTRLAIYGADEHARFLLDLVDLGDRVTAVVDPDPEKQGSRFLRWNVRDPQSIPELGVDAILVVTTLLPLDARAVLDELETAHGIELIRFLRPERAVA